MAAMDEWQPVTVLFDDLKARLALNPSNAEEITL
jgi:hypothetical protein